MAFDKDAFLQTLDGMSVLELNELVKAIEEKFGVSAAAMAAPAAGGAAAVLSGVAGCSRAFRGAPEGTDPPGTPGLRLLPRHDAARRAGAGAAAGSADHFPSVNSAFLSFNFIFRLNSI